MNRHLLYIYTTALLAAGFMTAATGVQAKKKTAENAIVSVKIGGYAGQRIDECIKHRVMAQNVDELVDVFRRQDEVRNMWGTEFWGKWVQGAMSAYRYNKDPQLYRMIADSERKILGCQLPDGYIGNYDKGHQLGGWDVWGRKYVLLGLIKWYDLSRDKEALQAARRLADYTMTQLGPGKEHIYHTGNYRGMASGSILEPIMFLYNRTGERKYLEFAQFLVSDGEEKDGAQLIARADTPVYKRHPVGTHSWFGNENGQKAYEMMSCYVGLLELAKATGRKDYVELVEKVVRHIEDEEINLCGSGSSSECWVHGRPHQTRPAYHSMETCAGFTWMQLNERLWQMTGRAKYADNIERTFYNAILASMKADGSQIAKYTPLEGFRHEGEDQCGLHINCCNANGPRAFAMIPRFAYSVNSEAAVTINLYGPSEATLLVNGNKVAIKQITDYPKTEKILIEILPERPTEFNLRLRIPAWSEQSIIRLNGQPIQNVTPGQYAIIQRTWQEGDKLELSLDLRTRLHLLNHMQALTRGPITLARDSRFGDGFVDETCIITQNDGIVEAHPVSSDANHWMTFEVEARTGTDREKIGKPHMLRFCDFASAGNTWEANTRYRVWLTQTFYAKDDRNIE